MWSSLKMRKNPVKYEVFEDNVRLILNILTNS